MKTAIGSGGFSRKITFVLSLLFLMGWCLSQAQETTDATVALNDASGNWDSISAVQLALQVSEAKPLIPCDQLSESDPSATYPSAQHSPASPEPWPFLPGQTRQLSFWFLVANSNGGEAFLLNDSAEDCDVSPTASSQTSTGVQMVDAGVTGGFEFAFNFPSDELWLEITNISGNAFNGWIHNSSALVPYAILSKQRLRDAAWSPAGTFYGDRTTNLASFSLPMLERNTLFLRAQANVAPGTLGAGFLYNVALKRDGTVSAWGVGDDGQLGNNNQWLGSPVPVPVDGLSNILTVAANGSFGLALDSSGVVWSWGMGWNGQLGRDDGLHENENVAAPVPGLSNIVAIVGGYDHAVALKSDGTVWTWGNNGLGQLGDGTTTRRDYAAPVPGLTNVIHIASGSDHNFALCTDGTVRGWGYNGNGALGIGNTDNQLQPIEVSGLTNVETLAGGFDFSLALLSDGTVRAWGDGWDGEMGDGNYRSSPTPMAVPGLSNIVAIACGGYHCLALNASGALFVWGYGYDGELGNGVQDDVGTPTLLSNVSNVVAIAGGEYSSMIMTADGTVGTWGVYGYYGASSDWREHDLPFKYDLYDTLDSDGDGLPDWFEVAIGTATNNADSDDDGFSDYWEVYADYGPVNPDDAPQIQLGFWKFDTTNWLGEAGQVPLARINLQSVPDWDGSALHIGTNATALLSYREIETNLSTIIPLPYADTVTQVDNAWNINLRKGAIRFWFKPDWSSVSAGGTGPGANAALILVGSHSQDYSNDFWGLECDANGEHLLFSSEGGGQQHVYASAPVSFSSNSWCQIVLTYNTNSSAIYTNGQTAVTGSGVVEYPDHAARQTLGFNIGSDIVGNEQAFCLFDNLETFNYPLSVSAVSSDYSQAISTATAVVQFPDSTLVTSNEMNLSIQGVPLATVWVSVLFNGTNYDEVTGQTLYANPGIQVPATLSLGDGAYVVSVGIWNGSSCNWTYQRIVLDTTPPMIVPGSQIVTTNSPLLQLTGYATEAISSISFDLVNRQATNLEQTGFITQSDGNTYAGAVSTNWFQCFDIKLAPGSNFITLRCADLAGNVSTNVYSYTLDTASMPMPTLAVDWPSNDAVLSGSTFTLQGRVSDPTATVIAQVMENGSANEITGVVERDGRFWIDNIPLTAATNFVNLTATDVASNSASASVTVQSSPVSITVDPMNGDALERSVTTVSGTINSGGYAVAVNGVLGTVWTNTDGSMHWQAVNVPVTTGGVASFQVQATQSSGDPETLVSFDKPTFIRMKEYNENINSQSLEHHLATCDPPYTQFYSQLLLQRVQQWTLGAGGSGVQDYYFYDQPIFGQPQTIGPAHTNWTWTAQDPPPALPWEHDDSGDGVTHVLDSCGAYYNYRRTAQTRVEVVAGGRAVPGQPTTVTLKATATEFISYVGDVSVPPQNIRMDGKVCVDSGDGSNGFVTVMIPAGADNLDITPLANSKTGAYSFDVTNINYAIAVDANRDGQIDFGSSDPTSGSNPYRFWVNNDYDGYDSAIADYDDLDPSTGDDAQNLSISCTRDLEDYTRLWINTRDVTQDLLDGKFLLALEWKSATDDPQMQFFLAAETNGGALYLTDATVAAQQVNAYGTHIIEYNHRNVLTKYNPFIFPPSFWAANVSTNQPVAHLLFDAVGRGSGQLVLALYKNDGVTKLAESQPLHLKLQDVKEMYERWTVGEALNSTPATMVSYVTSPYYYDSTIPADNNFILFVHGWNLPTWEKDAFAETAFKRLYWQGYKGHFGAFRWPTGYGFSGIISAITDARNYDNSESNAWASATGLVNLLSGLNSQYRNHVYLMAHSMGNVVASEALKQANSQIVNTYVAMQAAVPAHCYDPTTANRVTPTPPDRYAEYWANGASSYFSSSTGAGTYVNFYNANDWALGWWNIDQNWKPDNGLLSSPSYYYTTLSETYPSGFYKVIDSDVNLLFPADTYEIFAYADPSWSYALGAQPNVNGSFNERQINLQSVWPQDAHSGHDYSSHVWHSAEFNFDNMQQANFWNTLLGSQGLNLK